MEVAVLDNGTTARAVEKTATVASFRYEEDSDNGTSGRFIFDDQTARYECDSIGGPMRLDGEYVRNVEDYVQRDLGEWTRRRYGWPP